MPLGPAMCVCVLFFVFWSCGGGGGRGGAGLGAFVVSRATVLNMRRLGQTGSLVFVILSKGNAF